MTKKAGKLILSIILFSIGITGYAQDNVIDQIIWVVGDQAILKSDVEQQRLEMLSRGEQLKGDPYCFIPEQLAMQKLLLDQAKIDSIVAPMNSLLKEVNRQEEWMVKNAGSREKLEEWMGMTISEIRERLRENVRTQYLVEQVQNNIVGKVNLTPSEVRRYYSQLPQDSLPFVPTTVEVQIVTQEPKVPIQEIDAVKNRLREITERVNSGESFASMAILYSQDGSAMNGGETGFTGRASWVPEFATVAFSLSDPKKVSNIVETEYGYHIIQLIERRGDLVNVRHVLMKPKVPETEFVKTTLRMDSIVNDIKTNKFTFEDAASILSSDKDTRSNNGLMVNQDFESSNRGTPRFTMEELPPEIARSIANLKVGEISAPFRMIMRSNGKEVIATVKLRSRTEGHIANVSDDYQVLKAIVENKKKDEILNKWLDNKIKNTYIRIDEQWQNCDFKYSGWVKRNQQ